VKLRTSSFVRTFLVSIGTKAHYKFREKYLFAIVRTMEIFQGTHILGASRGLLCDSSTFLSLLCILYYFVRLVCYAIFYSCVISFMANKLR